jgi:chromosome segregation ATPase
MERSFRAAYNTGHDIYQARTRVNSTSSLINRKQQAIQSLEADKQDKLAEMIRQGLSSERRVMLLYDITNIEKDIHTTNTDISALQRDLEQQQAQLDYLLDISAY